MTTVIIPFSMLWILWTIFIVVMIDLIDCNSNPELTNTQVVLLYSSLIGPILIIHILFNWIKWVFRYPKRYKAKKDKRNKIIHEYIKNKKETEWI